MIPGASSDTEQAHGKFVATRHQGIQAHLQACLGTGLFAVCSGVNGATDSLWPDERTAVARAVPKRQREFAAGRAAARQAIRRLIGKEVSIPTHADRSPCWPAGIVGSIAHSGDVCLAVVGFQSRWRSIGIDVEDEQGIDEALWGIICTPDELNDVKREPPLLQARLVKRLFVAKEAFYKWYFPQWKSILDFHDVEVRWRNDRSAFDVDINRSVPQHDQFPTEGKVLNSHGHLIACFLSRSA
jgi:enterobactin synthetase component D